MAWGSRGCENQAIRQHGDVPRLRQYFRNNLSCQLLAPRTMKIDVPDAVRGELVEP